MLIDISENRLALAKTLGCDHVINMKDRSSNMEDCGKEIKAVCPRIDAAIECSGADSSVSLGIHVCSPNLIYLYSVLIAGVHGWSI